MLYCSLYILSAFQFFYEYMEIYSLCIKRYICRKTLRAFITHWFLWFHVTNGPLCTSDCSLLMTEPRQWIHQIIWTSQLWLTWYLSDIPILGQFNRSLLNTGWGGNKNTGKFIPFSLKGNKFNNCTTSIVMEM